MAKEITNTAASVHARLLNQARAGSRSFNDLLQLYAMERFLHRLSRTRHADRFVLKGALLMRAWDTSMFRTTRDIDLLARVSNEVAVLEGVVREACSASVDPDGLQFDAASVRGETIVEDADYPGVRVTFGGTLGNAQTPLQAVMNVATVGTTIAPASVKLTLWDANGTQYVVAPTASEIRSDSPAQPQGSVRTTAYTWDTAAAPIVASGFRFEFLAAGPSMSLDAVRLDMLYVPAPGALALLGMAAFVARRKRRA